MYFKNVLGNRVLKDLLIKESSSNQIPHAQLFVGGDQSQHIPMALAFATYLFCKEKSKLDSCGRCDNCIKMAKLLHPDLHFFYPTIKSQKGEERASESKKFFSAFQKMLLENPTLSIDGWNKKLKATKNASIRSADLLEICKIANFRSYEGEYKVFIIWCAEKIIQKSSSILLKTLEEPNPKTIFILISNNSNNLLATIKSRLQIKKFEKINADLMLEYFTEKYPGIDRESIEKAIIENNQNYQNILNTLDNSLYQNDIIKVFIYWIRLCFLSIKCRAKCMNPKTNQIELVIIQLINWSNYISGLEKAFQIKFVKISSDIFRHAFLINYNMKFPIHSTINDPDFNIANFSKYINNHNISPIFSLLSNTHYYLNRYANSKILFLDLSLALGKLLHKKN